MEPFFDPTRPTALDMRERYNAEIAAARERGEHEVADELAELLPLFRRRLGELMIADLRVLSHEARRQFHRSPAEVYRFMPLSETSEDILARRIQSLLDDARRHVQEWRTLNGTDTPDDIPHYRFRPPEDRNSGL